ncbi:MAG: protein-export chaperone SecB [Nevskia sp.]|nr:protein-export chaperone SecB [Nevskia sp.]
MAEAPPNTRQVLLQRIYLKDASLEVPHAPQVFARQWNPQVDVQVSAATVPLEAPLFQVTLSVTVTAKLEEDVGFLAEVHQAGIFHVSGFANETEVQAVLGGYCPGVVFPFAREAVAELVQRAGFPPMLLQPINFEALFAEHVARARAEAGAGAGGIVTVQ